MNPLEQIKMTVLERLKQAIEKTETAEGMPIKLVAIDGHGGSGKSTLAKALANELNAQILHTDDFASPDNMMEWGDLLIDRALEPIKKGAKTLSYPRTKWWPEHHPEPVVAQEVTPIMILEGVSAAGFDFRPYLAYAIWVDTPEDICLARGVERDKNQGTIDEVTETWRHWLAKEDQYIADEDPLGYADFIVDGTKTYQ